MRLRTQTTCGVASPSRVYPRAPKGKPAYMEAHRPHVIRPTIGTSYSVGLACAVAWSRVYRGMHRPLDLLAGSLMGIAPFAVILTALRPTRHELAHTPRGDDRREARA